MPDQPHRPAPDRDHPAPQNLVTGHVGLKVGDTSIEADVTLPAGPTQMRELLPVLQAWTDAIVQLAADDVAAEGRTVSCQAGCGACCRQLVPVTPSEAHAIAALVDALPEPRQSAIRARFAAAEARLEDTGLRARIAAMPQATRDDVTAAGLDYFALGVACPFLEDESCSIHPERPIACREYLVTSDPAHCAHPSAELVQMVGLPGRMSLALTRVETPPTPDDRGSMRGKIPLTLALAWARTHPEPPATVPGPDLFGQVLNGIARK